LPRALPCTRTLKDVMGDCAWLEGVYLVSVPTMPGPLKKAQGQPHRMIEIKPTLPGRHQFAAPFSRVVAYHLREGGREVF
jgi:hypothetical protein